MCFMLEKDPQLTEPCVHLPYKDSASEFLSWRSRNKSD